MCVQQVLNSVTSREVANFSGDVRLVYMIADFCDRLHLFRAEQFEGVPVLGNDVDPIWPDSLGRETDVFLILQQELRLGLASVHVHQLVHGRDANFTIRR